MCNCGKKYSPPASIPEDSQEAQVPRFQLSGGPVPQNLSIPQQVPPPQNQGEAQQPPAQEK